MPEIPFKICVVTCARSEYGLMRWPMQAIADDPRMILRTVVAGSHLSEEFGSTADEIEADGFAIDAQVPVRFGECTPRELARTVGDMTDGFAEALADLEPDLVLVMGDRYELLALAAASILLTVPMAHVSGGEITEGAIDEQIRHAMTKMSHLHFVANETYAARVRQMGEEGWRVCVSGEPGLDNLRKLELLSREELSRELGLDLSRPTALVTLHPVTLDACATTRQLAGLLEALEAADLQAVLTYPNVDAGGMQIIAALKDFVTRRSERAVLFPNLGQKRYLSALKHVAMMVGNSSSALFEAPSFKLPAVNIGDRQKGRMRAANVIDVGEDSASILAGIRAALEFDRESECENPYGDGRSSERIRDFVADVLANRSRGEILRKRFVDAA